MEGARLNKVSRLLEKELSIIFQQEARNLFNGAMITVTRVRVTSDLSLAKVYLSVFAVPEKEALLKVVIQHVWKIRHDLSQRIKKQMRVVPELHFYLDDSLDYLENIEKLLKK